MINKKVTLKSACILLLISCFNISNAQTYSFDHDNVNRSYIVHLPPSYSNSNLHAMVINMHGYGSNAVQEQFYSEMDGVADTANFIVVYPDGVNSSWNSGQLWSYNPGIDDVGFISALIDTMISNFSVDSTMVYACGMSNGGYMSYRLACELENKIAAIASITGVMSDSIYSNCQTDRPVPILHMHGTADSTVAYNGTPGNTGVETGIAWWVQNNNCPGTPTITNIPDINLTDGCTVDKYYYGPCDNSTEVVLFRVNGGEHTWPGVALPIGVTNQDIDGSGEVWKFFRKHQLSFSQPTGIAYDHKRINAFMAYPNPIENHLVIIPKNPSTLTLYNSQGQLLLNKEINHTYTLNTSRLSKGIYFLNATNEKGVYSQKVMKK